MSRPEIWIILMSSPDTLDHTHEQPETPLDPIRASPDIRLDPIRSLSHPGDTPDEQEFPLLSMTLLVSTLLPQNAEQLGQRALTPSSSDTRGSRITAHTSSSNALAGVTANTGDHHSGSLRSDRRLRPI